MRAALLLAVLSLALAGCAVPLATSGLTPHDGAAPLAGVHPYPSGTEWPAGLAGPFEMREVLRAKVPGFNGVELDGWIYLPSVPEGVKVPVVLYSSPYFGQLYTTPDLRDLPFSIGVEGEAQWLVENGYAVAMFSVRGTGNSGGCFEMMGPNEQKDQYHLVNWLGNQTWSNGRVAMTGGSYDGTTPWEAAIQNPEPLKTIVPIAPVTNFYTFYHTPQGAAFENGWNFQGAYMSAVSLVPPLLGSPERTTAEHAPLVPARACPEFVEVFREVVRGEYGDERNAGFWEARRLIQHFPNITAAVLLAHGFQDNDGSGHQQEENAVWHALTKAPKRMIEGQWGHARPQTENWQDELLAWLDYWLKGIGNTPPKLGLVEYEDNGGTWRTTTAWPPADAREETLYLAGGKLAPHPAEGDASFRSAPRYSAPDIALCPPTSALSALGGDAPGIVYLSDPLAQPAVIAGNPFAYLRVSSSQPGGLLALHVYAIPETFQCDLVNGEPVPSTGEARLLGWGVAELRYHQGNYRAIDFPVGTPANVRVDITNFAEVIPEGHRVAVVASYGIHGDRSQSGPYAPTITIHGGATPDAASHVVLPLVEGTLGGAAPSLAYPPRPFVPQVP